MADKIKFLKVRKVKNPNRAYPTDAGLDFFVPEFDKSFVADLKEKNPLVFGKSFNSVKYGGDIYLGVGNCNTNGTITMIDDNGKDAVEYNLTDVNDTLFKFDEEKGENYFLLNPHSRVMIPSGVKVRMSEPGRALIAGNKSGIATKHGIIFGAQIIDYTYKGEIHISIINTGTKSVRIYENMKIIQFVETPIFNSEVEVLDSSDSDEKGLEEISKSFYEGLKDDRGSGGFGSTDKKK